MTTSKTVNGARTTARHKAGAVVKESAKNGSAATSTAPPTPRASAAARAGAAAAAEAARLKPKLVRDSFTIPKAEYAVLDALKHRAARLMRPTKKSEILRAGIAALEAMNDEEFLSVINGVPSLKTGRPKSTAPLVAGKTVGS